MMEEENNQSNVEDQRILCFNQPKTKEWIWLYIIAVSSFSFLLHTMSLLTDSSIVYILYAHQGKKDTALVLGSFIYLPTVFLLFMKPPSVPPDLTLLEFILWLVQILVLILLSPILFSVRLLKRFFWTISALRDKKPCTEVLNEYEEYFSKEEHSYVFLQAFLHCAPQAIVQLNFLIHGIAIAKLTECLQVTSVIVSIILLASCTVSFHRYQAQVVGGRLPVLLMRPPETTEGTHLATSVPLLPIRFCLQSKPIGLEMDCPLGKVVAFCSWFLLIFGRILCITAALIFYKTVTKVALFVHFSVMLLYLLSSQPTTLCEMPSRIINALISLVTLVEVSVRFNMVPLMYTLYFICMFVEDTVLLILFFVYRPNKCIDRDLNCSYFNVYAYLVLNAHVIGMIIFGIFLARFRPHRKFLLSSFPTTITETN